MSDNHILTPEADLKSLERKRDAITGFSIVSLASTLISSYDREIKPLHVRDWTHLEIFDWFDHVVNMGSTYALVHYFGRVVNKLIAVKSLDPGARAIRTRLAAGLAVTAGVVTNIMIETRYGSRLADFLVTPRSANDFSDLGYGVVGAFMGGVMLATEGQIERLEHSINNSLQTEAEQV